MKKYCWMLGFLGISGSSVAMNCYFTALKDSCWLNYDVTIQLISGENGATVTYLTIPKGKSWARTKISCSNGDGFSLSATFNPPIWEKDKGRVFKGNTILRVPDKLPQGYVSWDVRSTYPNNFARIPMPASTTGACRVDWSQVPEVQLKAGS